MERKPWDPDFPLALVKDPGTEEADRQAAEIIAQFKIKPEDLPEILYGKPETRKVHLQYGMSDDDLNKLGFYAAWGTLMDKTPMPGEPGPILKEQDRAQLGDAMTEIMHNIAIRTFSDFQRQAASIAAQAWPNDVPGEALEDTLIARACEELGELAGALRKRRGPRLGHPGEAPGTAAEVGKELGDLLFCAARIATLAGVQLSDSAVGVIAKIRSRVQSLPHG